MRPSQTSLRVNTHSKSNPRHLRIERRDNGFGFTLRHFIVYPSDEGSDAGPPIQEPMDTIFVKSVREPGPAAVAGLNVGDRVVSVNGETVAGYSYAQVVQMIQNSKGTLYMVVVPQQDDILQVYFSDIARNPETNKRNEGGASPTPAQAKLPWAASLHSSSSSRESSPLTSKSPSLAQGPIYGHTQAAQTQMMKDNVLTYVARRQAEPLTNLPTEPVENIYESLSFARQPQSSHSSSEHVYAAVPAKIIGSSSTTPSISSDSTVEASKSRESLDSDSSILAGFTPQKQEKSNREDNFRDESLKRLTYQVNSSRPIHSMDPSPYGISMQASTMPRTKTKIAMPNIKKNIEVNQFHDYGFSSGNRKGSSEIELNSFEQGNFSDHKHHSRQPQTFPQHIPSISYHPPPVDHHTMMHPHFPGVPHQFPAMGHHQHHPAVQHNLQMVPHHLSSVPPHLHAGPHFSEVQHYSAVPHYLPTMAHHTSAMPCSYCSCGCGAPCPACLPVAPCLACVTPTPCPTCSVMKSMPQHKHNSLYNVPQVNHEKDKYTRAQEAKQTFTPTLSPSSVPLYDNKKPVQGSRPRQQVPKLTGGGKVEMDRKSRTQNRDTGTQVNYRRSKSSKEDREEKHLRRVSYIQATKVERMEIEDHSANGNVTVEAQVHGPKKIKKSKSKSPTPDLQKFKSKSPILEDPPVKLEPHTTTKTEEEPLSPSPEVTSENTVMKGFLNCKVNEIEGKDTSKLPWTTVYVFLKSNMLQILKDEKGTFDSLDIEEERVNLVESEVEVASEGQKQKYSFRVKTGKGTEYIFQSENDNLGKEWITAIEQVCKIVPEKKKDNWKLHKLTSFRNRSPSPTSKSRKSKEEQTNLSVKDKDRDKITWKVKMVKQWKKIGGLADSDQPSYPEGGSIGVPLEECPLISDGIIPFLVKLCCDIVIDRGLQHVGVYRVPGNNASVNYLTEQVNRGLENFELEDSRWQDINVVSSLLKSFFRKLPDPLFTMGMYSLFIEASKIDGASLRLNQLRKLIWELPEIHLETLKYVAAHLCEVARHSDQNKMEVRNLAIVFGPTLVRTNDDNMVSMVTDMSQQCQIIESILSNWDFFFTESMDLESALIKETESKSEEGQFSVLGSNDNQTVMLENLQKLEDSGKVGSPKGIVTSIISTANRKMLRVTSKGLNLGETESGSSNNEGRTKSTSKESLNDKKSNLSETEKKYVAKVDIQQTNFSEVKPVLNLTNKREEITTNSEKQEQNILPAYQDVSSRLKQKSSHSAIESKDRRKNSTTQLHSNLSASMQVQTILPLSGAPMDTYAGLDAETAGRIARLESDYKAGSKHQMPSSLNYEENGSSSCAISIVSSSSKSGSLAASISSSLKYPLSSITTPVPSTGGNPVEGGIFIEESYQTEAYKNPSDSYTSPLGQSENRFVSLTYGNSLPNIYSDVEDMEQEEISNIFPSINSDHQKVIASESIRPSDSSSSNPTDQNNGSRGRDKSDTFYYDRGSEVDEKQSKKTSEMVLSNLTASFDQKMRLLLDPHYQSNSQNELPIISQSESTNSESNQQQLSKKQIDEAWNLNLQQAKTSQQSSLRCEELPGNKRVERQTGDRQPILKPVKRSDSLTKQEKTKLNMLKSRGKENSVASLRERFEQHATNREQTTVTVKFSRVEVNKLRKKLSDKNRKRIKRRHTVGGTKDLPVNIVLRGTATFDRLAPLRNMGGIVHSSGGLNEDVRRSSLPVEEQKTWRHSLPCSENFVIE